VIGIAEAFVSSLLQLFLWNTFLLLLLGIALGFAVGILPGLGGSAALALMLPFTFKMEPLEAFAFLLGMAAVIGTTGDITSIVFGIPGEPHTAATILDGHAMAMHGEAGRALGAALTSSLIGACVGALALAAAIPVMRPLVLLIGYAEFFMLSLLGITYVAALSSGSLHRGMIAAGLGLLLSMVGLDPHAGVARYTFGQLFLWDGVGVVTVVLGLFAIPELIDLAVVRSGIAQQETGRLGGVLQGVRDAFRHWALVLRCSALGAYIGVIPGMGASVGQWIAYAHARQSAADKERFGRGAVEGVLGPGAANNSTLGGALIPAVAFGVPSSAFMAVLMGAFIIQGLVPGPKMLVPEREGGHLGLTFSFVWMIIVSNMITVVLSFLFLNQLARITRIRVSLLLPVILILTYLGAFAEKNAFEDMVVMLAAGMLGWVMVQLDWPRPPLVIGLVLGGLIENNLFLATSSEGAAWLARPGVLLLAAAIVSGVFYSMLRRGRFAETTQEVPAPTVPGGYVWDVVFSLFLVALFAFALWQGVKWPAETALFPRVIAIPTLVLAIVYLVRVLAKRPQRIDRLSATQLAPGEALLRWRLVRIWGWIIAFFLAIWLLGFPIAVPLTMLLHLRLSGRERWPVTMGVTVITALVLAGLFQCFLHLPFPAGILMNWLERVSGVNLGRFVSLSFGC
jgi:TctA family transporter